MSVCIKENVNLFFVLDVFSLCLSHSVASRRFCHCCCLFVVYLHPLLLYSGTPSVFVYRPNSLNIEIIIREKFSFFSATFNFSALVLFFFFAELRPRLKFNSLIQSKADTKECFFHFFNVTTFSYFKEMCTGNVNWMYVRKSFEYWVSERWIKKWKWENLVEKLNFCRFCSFPIIFYHFNIAE